MVGAPAAACEARAPTTDAARSSASVAAALPDQ